MTACRIAPGVHWVVGRTSLTIVDEEGTAKALGYPGAAVWDFISRGYPLSDVETLVAAVAALDRPAAQALVRSALAEWAAAGYVERA
jgi:hypothetical protein